jgi:L-lactate permease
LAIESLAIDVADRLTAELAADRQAPELGALGVFLTRSDTSSNTLFGPLQAQTAQQLGNVSPVLTAATNSSGGVMGKMISPQNLSVGAAGVNKVGSEGEIFRRTI